jgi:hypothetical protein
MIIEEKIPLSDLAPHRDYLGCSLADYEIL